MPSRPRKLARVSLVVLTALALFITPARAEEEKGPFREPGIRYVAYRKPYVEWIAGTLIIVACLLVTCKNPHRTHLD